MAGKLQTSPQPYRVVLLSMDAHLASAAASAERHLRSSIPGLTVELHAASEWKFEGPQRAKVLASIEAADIIIAGMLFLEDQFTPLLPALRARAAQCDAIVGCLSAPEIVKLTRLGKFVMDKPESGVVSLLKRLRGGNKPNRSGESQAKMLRRLPKILKYIPGTAQDVRFYFLTMQYWLGGSDDNITNLVAALINRYAQGEHAALQGTLPVGDPIIYPETGIYHPRMNPRIGSDLAALPAPKKGAPKIGVLIMRSYVLSKDTAHYDGVINALEARGLEVIPAFASGLDARPAIDAFFKKDGKPQIDALLSLTGFSLVGGPAYNDAGGAAKALQALDVPYIAAHALEFQDLTEWGASTQGLSPVEATMMVAMPELDGASAPTLFGGRSSSSQNACGGCSKHCAFTEGQNERAMQSCPERAQALAARVEGLVRLRKTPKEDKKAAVVLFNFPPNSGATGTAAHLAVFESLYNLLVRMEADGYHVDLPASVDDLRDKLIIGNAAQYGADANVQAWIPTDDHVRREPHLADIEAQWGAAPGRQQADGSSIQVLGAQFGNIFVGLQPAFGYEGDPMRLLFESGFAPTHAFSAFYRYLREDFGADAVIHFGTHGALEFMPGKQTAPSANCWPTRLIGDVPHFYFYAANNPSEAAIAKRRSAAVTISYLTASVTEAGLYRSLADLKSSIHRWRTTSPEERSQRQSLALLIQAQASSLDLTPAEPPWDDNVETAITSLQETLTEYEERLIPDGLHVAGALPSADQRLETLLTIAGPKSPEGLPQAALQDIVEDKPTQDILDTHQLSDQKARLLDLVRINKELQREHELTALLRALAGGFIPPAPGGDLVSNSAIVPTGRNIHGFDPFRMPSAFALSDGAKQAQRLIDRHIQDHGSLPETVAFVLWGTDNLKSEGAQVAQALALIGAEPRFDHYGRLTGAVLVPLEKLGRPRIDVMATLSGIFRDLLPMQTKLLAEAALAAATADEPLDQNFVRRNTLAYQRIHGVDFETAALRVFSNADGAYGSNVNQLIDAGCWDDDRELASAYTNRKCFAYGVDGQPQKQSELLNSLLADTDLAYQNLESIELGITTIDHYVDTLGGIGRAAKEAKGDELPVYIGDQTMGAGKVRSLSEQVTLESRTRTLNPKWYEGLLRHGYEGVRQIEAQVTNTLGWSATTGDVAPWVYQEIANTYLLDKDLRNRLADLNPKACTRVAHRLLEASQRQYWSPDPETLNALQDIGDELEDRLEGILPPEGATA